ncbi:hypothetical protein ACFO3O_21205 [Dokdonia ponticola]|uniref:Uncharacterized protein n=1 Tax=Dokdonia ponticola TaxID=2041041 RepID=A0ABV9I4R5_9FLAO
MSSVSFGNRPMPNFRRIMGFVDGENLVFNYQSLKKEKTTIKTNVEHHEDVFVWNPYTINCNNSEVLRVTLYTYAVGSESLLTNINKKIKDLWFIKHHMSELPDNLSPCVFKKEKKGKKTKGVDIKRHNGHK